MIVWTKGMFHLLCALQVCVHAWLRMDIESFRLKPFTYSRTDRSVFSISVLWLLNTSWSNASISRHETKLLHYRNDGRAVLHNSCWSHYCFLEGSWFVLQVLNFYLLSLYFVFYCQFYIIVVSIFSLIFYFRIFKAIFIIFISLQIVRHEMTLVVDVPWNTIPFHSIPYTYTLLRSTKTDTICVPFCVDYRQRT